MTNSENKSTFQIMCVMFLCIIMPFSYTSLTIDPVLHLRFILWAIFLFITLMMTFQKKSICFLRELFVIQKYHLLLIFFIFVSFLSIFSSVNVSEAIFDLLKNCSDTSKVSKHLIEKNA